MKNILYLARLTIKIGLGITFIIFSIISALFVLSSILYFVVPQLNRLNFQPPSINAVSMGITSINIFLIFLSIFLSLGVLSGQFARGNLIFMLSKPLKASELLLGSSLGLIFVLLLYWLFLSLEVIIIILVFDKSFFLPTLVALLPIVLLIPIYVSLCVFFFSLWPSYLCAIFPFLFIFTSFARVDIITLISHTNIAWLKELIKTSFFFIPPVGQIIAISMNAIDLINVHINVAFVILNSIFICFLLQALGARRISRALLNL